MNTPIHADKAASLADLAVSTSSGAARVCDDASRASATAAPTEQEAQPMQFLGMSDDEEPMARYFIKGGL